MIIFLRQDSINVGTSCDYKLSLVEAGFIKVRFIEVFADRIEFLPLDQDDELMIIEKVNEDCWLEPITGITYEYLFIYPLERIQFFPQHLEIKSNNTELLTKQTLYIQTNNA